AAITRHTERGHLRLELGQAVRQRRQSTRRNGALGGQIAGKHPLLAATQRGTDETIATDKRCQEIGAEKFLGDTALTADTKLSARNRRLTGNRSGRHCRRASVAAGCDTAGEQARSYENDQR